MDMGRSLTCSKDVTTHDTVIPLRQDVVMDKAFFARFSPNSRQRHHYANNPVVEGIFSKLLSRISEGWFVLDSELNYVAVNQQFLAITRLPKQQILGKFFSFHSIDGYPPNRRKSFEHILSLLQTGQTVDEMMTFSFRQGQEVLARVQVFSDTLPDNTLIYYGILTEANQPKLYRRALESKLNYDPLTQLPTLDNFLDAAEIAINLAAKLPDTPPHLALIRLNIDKLQAFNDSLGFEATNQLLIKFVERIHQLPLNGSTVQSFARLGGDNFAILLNTGELAEVYHYLDKLSQALELPFFVDNAPYSYIRVSVGVAVFPRDSQSAESLLNQAESALKQARLAGGDDIVWYEKAHRDGLFKDVHLASAFNQALSNAEIVAFFQPKVMFAQPDQPMFEALIRWQHPVLGTLTPQAFLDEVIHGMSQRLFETVIQSGIEQIIAWRRLGFFVKVCINIDARQFNNERFLAFVNELMARYPCFVRHIEFELTEIARLVDRPNAIATLQQFREKGVLVAIDDFGTGYASLSYLLDFPVDLLKIDRRFIQNIHLEANKQKIVNMMIELAHSLGIKAIAEGVETVEERDFLAKLGCDGIQGYLVSPPMSAEQATQWLNEHFTADPAIADAFNARYPLG